MTLVELLIVIALIGIFTFIGVPEIVRFSSNYKVRSGATDLLQNMRLTRAVAIKENRQYLIVFNINDGNYEIGPDKDQDGILDSVWKRVDLSGYGGPIDYGTLATRDPSGDVPCANGKACFGRTSPPRAEFNPNGSVANPGSVYLQHSGRGYSYLVRVSSNAGTLNMWRWTGDAEDSGATKWVVTR